VHNYGLIRLLFKFLKRKIWPNKPAVVLPNFLKHVFQGKNLRICDKRSDTS
jgi:hypothetical protein